MSARAARFLAIPCGIAAIAMAFWTHKFWPGDGSFLSKVLILAATVSIPFALYVLVTLPVSRRPSSFSVKRQRFFAPLEPQRAGLNVIVWMWLGGELLVTTNNLEAGAIMAAGFFLMAVAWLITWRPWIALTPTGLVVQRFRRRSVVAWDDIAPGEPQTPRKRKPRSLNLYLTGEPLYGTIPLCEEIPVGSFYVDTTFLVGAIRHYAGHPENRAAIGTEAEHDRLMALLGQAAPNSAAAEENDAAPDSDAADGNEAAPDSGAAPDGEATEGSEAVEQAEAADRSEAADGSEGVGDGVDEGENVRATV